MSHVSLHIPTFGRQVVIGPFKGINKDSKDLFLMCSVRNLVLKHRVGFWMFSEFLEGSGSSGRLVGMISTHPGTSQTL